MLSNVELIEAVRQETAPISTPNLAKKLGLKTNQIIGQANRLVHDGKLGRAPTGELCLPEVAKKLAGANRVEEPPPNRPFGDEQPPDETGDEITTETEEETGKSESEPKTTTRVAQGVRVLTPSHEQMGVTDYQMFLHKGRQVGIVEQVVQMTAAHVWDGGDYHDLEWIWKALGEMQIRGDLRERWFHSWRSYLHKGIPDRLRDVVQIYSGSGKEEGEEEEGRGTRDYIIDDDLPIYVGEGSGDYTLKDAKEIVRARALKQRFNRPAGGEGGSQGLSVHDIKDIIDMVRPSGDGGAPAKTFVVTQGPQGTQVQELEPGQPLVMNQPVEQPQNNAPWIFDPSTGQLRQANPGEPMVFHQPAAPQPKTYFVDQSGNVKTANPGEPIVIVQQPPTPPASGLSATPVQLRDEHGNPLILNLETLLALRKFESEDRRANERHQTWMGMAQTVRENMPAAIQAIRETAQSMKGSQSSQTERSREAPAQAPNESTPVYQCGDCGSQFQLPPPPPGGQWAGARCPNCGKTYTTEELGKATEVTQQ